jgi:dimeric dUTPase (all-alpha-NTP-PPase superfamily)
MLCILILKRYNKKNKKDKLMEKKITQLVNLQNNLNNMTNGTEWTEGTTNKGKTINWITAMVLEGSEAIDSTPWKHWKAIEGVSDIENIKIEVVDIIHFLISELIAQYGEKTTIEKLTIILKDASPKAELDYKEFNKVTKIFMLKALSIELSETQYTYTELIASFKEMMNEATLSFDELYNLYIMKNALNQIRQNNGYKEGTYIKIWNGEEDNVVLHKMIEEHPYTPFEEILENLQKIYDNLKKD